MTASVNRAVFRRLAAIAAAAAIAVTLCTLLAVHAWLFELSTHFRLQMAVAALLLAAGAALLRAPVPAFLLAAVGVWHGFLIADYALPDGGAAGNRPATFSLLSVNVSRSNTDYAAVKDLVVDTSPDVVALMEVDRAWVDALADLEGSYPYRIARPEDGYYGLAIFSRYPLRERPGSPLAHGGVQTAILADLQLGSGTALLAAVHLRAPTSPTLARARNEQLETLAGLFRSRDAMPGILVGDLNITPWSPWYGVLESNTGLVNAGLGQGYLRTWPTRPFLLGIPIDHCLVSPEFPVIDARTLRDVGSDHLPLYVEMTAPGSL